MFAVHFYASCFDSTEKSIGKKNLWLDWEKAVYRPLFALANTLPIFRNSCLLSFAFFVQISFRWKDWVKGIMQRFRISQLVVVKVSRVSVSTIACSWKLIFLPLHRRWLWEILCHSLSVYNQINEWQALSFSIRFKSCFFCSILKEQNNVNVATENVFVT